MHICRKSNGLTLIEILLACFLFMLCLGVVVSTFSATARTYFNGQKRLEMQSVIRSSLDIMCSEMREMYGNPTIGMGGADITYDKFDNLKGKKLIRVDYHYDKDGENIRRRDYDGAGMLSEARIGSDIKNLHFTYVNRKVTIDIVAEDPVTREMVTYTTCVVVRSGTESLSVKSIGRKEKTGSSSLWSNSP